MLPSTMPSQMPSNGPSSMPSLSPSLRPSGFPTFMPSSHPSDDPTLQPSYKPTLRPSRHPSYAPSSNPTASPSSLQTANIYLQISEIFESERRRYLLDEQKLADSIQSFVNDFSSNSGNFYKVTESTVNIIQATDEQPVENSTNVTMSSLLDMRFDGSVSASNETLLYHVRSAILHDVNEFIQYLRETVSQSINSAGVVDEDVVENVALTYTPSTFPTSESTLSQGVISAACAAAAAAAASSSAAASSAGGGEGGGDGGGEATAPTENMETTVDEGIQTETEIEAQGETEVAMDEIEIEDEAAVDDIEFEDEADVDDVEFEDEADVDDVEFEEDEADVDDVEYEEDDDDDEVNMDDVAFEYEEEEGGSATRRRANARGSMEFEQGEVEGGIGGTEGAQEVTVEDVAFEFEEEDNKSSSQRRNRMFNKKAMPTFRKHFGKNVGKREKGQSPKIIFLVVSITKLIFLRKFSLIFKCPYF